MRITSTFRSIFFLLFSDSFSASPFRCSLVSLSLFLFSFGPFQLWFVHFHYGFVFTRLPIYFIPCFSTKSDCVPELLRLDNIRLLFHIFALVVCVCACCFNENACAWIELNWIEAKQGNNVYNGKPFSYPITRLCDQSSALWTHSHIQIQK